MRFTIPKGDDFYCEFEVKEPGQSTPMDLTDASGTFSLSTIGLGTSLILDDIPITVEDAVNGVVSITLSSAQTADLITKRGFPEDGYPLIPTYKAHLQIVADNPISVVIPKVYVNDDGA